MIVTAPLPLRRHERRARGGVAAGAGGPSGGGDGGEDARPTPGAPPAPADGRDEREGCHLNRRLLPKSTLSPPANNVAMANAGLNGTYYTSPFETAGSASWSWAELPGVWGCLNHPALAI